MTMSAAAARDVPKVLGICGGIGSGKSTASRLLVSKMNNCNAFHLEADKIAHSVYTPGSQALQEIASEFGSHLLGQEDGSLNRQALGEIVFSSPTRLAALERIVWPHVRMEIQEAIDSYSRTSTKRENNIIVLEAAVLVDAGWQDMCDALWVINVDPEVATKRLQTVRGFSKEDAEQRLEAQQSRRCLTTQSLQREVDSGVVSCVISNDGSLEDLEIKLQEALNDDSNWY